MAGFAAGLFRTEGPGSPVVRRGERRRIDIHAGKDDEPTLTELLTPNLGGALEVLHVEVPPGYSSEEAPFTHEGEECGIVLSGRLEVTVGEQTAVV